MIKLPAFLAFLAVLALSWPAWADMFPDGSNAKLPATGTPATTACVDPAGKLLALASGCLLDLLPNAGSGADPGSANRYLWLNQPGTNADSAPQARIVFNFPGNYHSAYMVKTVSGSTVSVISDGNFNTLTVNHSNQMQRAAVGDWYNSNGASLRAETYMGNGSPVRGSGNAVVARAYLYDQADAAAGKTGTEAQSLDTYTLAVKGRNNAHAMIWGPSSGVVGPTTGQEGGLFGFPVYVYKRNPASAINISSDGNSDHRGAYGITVQSIPGNGVQTAPGSPEENIGTATYPLDTAMSITGYTGDYDGANQALDGFDATARALATVAFQIGGLSQGPWYEGIRGPRRRPNSKIANAIDITQFTGAAINIHDRHPANTGTAINVTATGGTSSFMPPIGLGVAAPTAYQVDMLGDVRVQAAVGASLYLTGSGAAANEKNWMVGTDSAGAAFALQTKNDDKSFGENAYIITRSGPGLLAQDWYINNVMKLHMTAAGLKIGTIPTSAGAGGLVVCIDSAGVLYKKASCP